MPRFLWRGTTKHENKTRWTINPIFVLKGWTQAELARHCGISATNLSLLENDKVEIGKKRVEQIGKAFAIQPAIIK